MDLKPKQKPNYIVFETIDSHTMGEPTRIVTKGFPDLIGNTMIERKKYLEEYFDHYRTALMLEPRGHKDMFGAILTEPISEEADLGVVFMDTGGYLNMCGHGSIGLSTVVVETGLVEVTEPYTEVVLEAPAGLIRAKVKVEKGRAIEASILNVPSFMYRKDLMVEITGYGQIVLDISFGGSFFALIDAEKIGLVIDIWNIEQITDLGMKIIKKVNDTVEIRHPYLDITSVDLVEFYCSATNPLANKKNVVIFGDRQVDRSPCGTGTSAKLALLYANGEIKIGEEYVYESITGSMFKGTITREIDIGDYKAVIPQITGSAYITGFNKWVIDEADSLGNGFLFGKRKEGKKQSERTVLIKSAWELFEQNGYEETGTEDICRLAGVSLDVFHKYFREKDDLIDTLSDLFDATYEDLMVEMNPRISHYEQLLYLNKELFSMIEKNVPFELIRYSYSKQMENENHISLMNQERLYYKLLDQIIKEGQNKEEFTTDSSYQEISKAYSQLERGMIYDWCVNNASYGLAEYSRKMLPVYLKQYLK
jgi:proline racemase/trans-L-3-hydroxyproline dehydratase